MGRKFSFRAGTKVEGWQGSSYGKWKMVLRTLATSVLSKGLGYWQIWIGKTVCSSVGGGVGATRGGSTEPNASPYPLKLKAFYLSLLSRSIIKRVVYVCKFAREGSGNICKTMQCLERNSSNKRCIILNALNFDSGNSCTRVSISRQRRYHMTAHVKAPWSPLVDSHPLSHSPLRGLLALPLPPAS